MNVSPKFNTLEGLLNFYFNDLIYNDSPFASIPHERKVKTNPDNFFDNPLQEFGYTQTVKLMHFLKSNGHVDQGNYERANILDFGAGVGGSTIFFHDLKNKIAAVDLNEGSLACLRSRKIMPEGSIVNDDGLELMKKTSDKVYDLVFALMFGPTDDKEFISTFLEEANRIIKDNGKVIVFSEMNTMSHFIESKNGKKVNLPLFIGGIAYVASKQ